MYDCAQPSLCHSSWKNEAATTIPQFSGALDHIPTHTKKERRRRNKKNALNTSFFIKDKQKPLLRNCKGFLNKSLFLSIEFNKIWHIKTHIPT